MEVLTNVWKITAIFDFLKNPKTWITSLDFHRTRNPHHPQYFKSEEEIGSEDKKEMLLDYLSSFMVAYLKKGLKITKEQAAHGVSERYPNWPLVAPFYNGGTNENYDKTVTRWNLNPEWQNEKDQLIALVKSYIRNEITYSVFAQDLYTYKCVHEYIRDLLWHKHAVEELCLDLFPDDDKLWFRVKEHDQDKFDAYMVASYVLKWMFNVEEV